MAAWYSCCAEDGQDVGCMAVVSRHLSVTGNCSAHVQSLSPNTRIRRCNIGPLFYRIHNKIGDMFSEVLSKNTSTNQGFDGEALGEKHATRHMTSPSARKRFDWTEVKGNVLRRSITGTESDLRSVSKIRKWTLLDASMTMKWVLIA
jgi:hypothetical protein